MTALFAASVVDVVLVVLVLVVEVFVVVVLVVLVLVVLVLVVVVLVVLVLLVLVFVTVPLTTTPAESHGKSRSAVLPTLTQMYSASPFVPTRSVPVAVISSQISLQTKSTTIVYTRISYCFRNIIQSEIIPSSLLLPVPVMSM